MHRIGIISYCVFFCISFLPPRARQLTRKALSVAAARRFERFMQSIMSTGCASSSEVTALALARAGYGSAAGREEYLRPAPAGFLRTVNLAMATVTVTRRRSAVARSPGPGAGHGGDSRTVTITEPQPEIGPPAGPGRA